jgi:hypothetical protein
MSSTAATAVLVAASVITKEEETKLVDLCDKFSRYGAACGRDKTWLPRRRHSRVVFVAPSFPFPLWTLQVTLNFEFQCTTRRHC